MTQHISQLSGIQHGATTGLTACLSLTLSIYHMSPASPNVSTQPHTNNRAEAAYKSSPPPRFELWVSFLQDRHASHFTTAAYITQHPSVHQVTTYIWYNI